MMAKFCEINIVEIFSFRYPIGFAFAHYNVPDFKAKKRGEKLVLNVWFGAHLQEIHYYCQKEHTFCTRCCATPHSAESARKFLI
jgi:hypothetical protein